MTNEQLLEICEERESVLEKIKNTPICLKWGKFECRVENDKVYYSRWTKKKRDCIVGVKDYAILNGGVGNQKLVWELCHVYIDKDGNEFKDLEYWDREDIKRKDWFK